jgi:polyferredoxin
LKEEKRRKVERERRVCCWVLSWIFWRKIAGLIAEKRLKFDTESWRRRNIGFSAGKSEENYLNI